MALMVPQITHDDMLSFHQAHFSQLATAHFGSHFLRPTDPATALENNDVEPEIEDEYCTEEYYDEEEYYGDDDEDDGLGYYPDGVKRTLTDEQIAIFRHSELETLRRAKEAEDVRVSKKRSAPSSASPPALPKTADENEDGEIPDAGNCSEEGEIDGPAPKRRKKNNRRKKARTRADGVVIDLRKRTWDVVETGLETLDYEEDEGQRPVRGGAMQRRTISYDD